MKKFIYFFALCFVLSSCQDESADNNNQNNNEPMVSAIELTFGDNIDLENLLDYANQVQPGYIQKDNTNANDISNANATLGRVLFYDKKLSVDNTVSCATCHQQKNAFGDTDQLSVGVNGVTGRHSMRLVNARFADEQKFFWDERAETLEAQTTMPIQDHAEMGFSGQNGDPGFNDLIVKLEAEEYYNELFTFVYGDRSITEERMQESLAQFIRSIQSFDSKYDEGRATVNNNNAVFPNFTPEENDGKILFNLPIQFEGDSGIRIGGGLGCNGCHNAPEFDINPNSRTNGVNSVAQSNLSDFTVTRSPTLRDLFDQNGNLNGPLMHNGVFTTINQVIDHYNNIQALGNINLDQRLARGGGINLNITAEERSALIAFLKTLSGSDMYANEKWSDPF